MAGADRIDGRYVGFQPETHEILAAFSLYSEKLPQDEQILAKGLLATVEKAKCIGMDRFVDRETGQLTDAARTSLARLQQEHLLTPEGISFVIPPLDTPFRDKLSSLIRMYFKPEGTAVLQEAAATAGRVWSPQ